MQTTSAGLDGSERRRYFGRSDCVWIPRTALGPRLGGGENYWRGGKVLCFTTLEMKGEAYLEPETTENGLTGSTEIHQLMPLISKEARQKKDVNEAQEASEI
jgi:hypothetical protein